MSEVFISYKAEDRARVEPLVGALEAEGLGVWWDARVSGGEAWREEIARQLDAAKCVIVVWSKRSTGPDGRFVRDEATRAQRRGAYLPITIDKVEPPLGFGETQALPLRSWKGDPSDPRYRAVSDCVHSLLGRDRPAGPAAAAGPAKAVRIDRRTAIAAGGVAIVAAGAGGWLLLRPAAAKANTIAVLPFANLSGDPAQGYFSDGMAEEVRSALAATGGLEVVARTSSEMLRNADAVSAAKRLEVANVVTGSVRRSPSTVRVSAQLVDGESGLERWSQSFDRPMGDVLQIQSDIAANVAQALSVALGSTARQRIALGGTSNPEALDLLLQATATEGDDSSAGMLRRVALLEKATQLDPDYAEAHARKALYQDLWANAWAGSNAERLKAENEALQSTRRAISIAPTMALGYSSLGLIYFNRLEMKKSLEALAHSVELPGAPALSFINYSVILVRFRRDAESQVMIDRGTSLDPLNPVVWQQKTWTHFLARKYPQSIEAGRRAISIAPENRRARTLVAWDLIFLGRQDEAVRELQSVPEDDYRRIVAEGAIAARSGNKQGALAAISELQRRYGDTVHYQEAQIYAQLGDVDQTIAALEAAWAVRDSGLAAIQVDPFLDPIRKDPRISPIVRRIFG